MLWAGGCALSYQPVIESLALLADLGEFPDERYLAGILRLRIAPFKRWCRPQRVSVNGPAQTGGLMWPCAKTEVENVAVLIVDEDDSELSRRIAGGVLEPQFKRAVHLTPDQIDPGMNSGRFVFVLEIPPKIRPGICSAAKGRQSRR
jgi:hypothetical protein